MHAGPRQQFGDDLLVYLGVLPHVQSRQVKTKDVHGFPQPGQPILGQHRAAVGAQGHVDDVQVGQEFGRASIALEAQVESVFGLPVEDFTRRRGESRVDDPQSAAIRFVGAGRLVTLVGQRTQFVADRDQPRRHRQFLFAAR